jgi:hypothetical protein
MTSTSVDWAPHRSVTIKTVEFSVRRQRAEKREKMCKAALVVEPSSFRPNNENTTMGYLNDDIVDDINVS